MTPTELEKICANYISDQGLMSKMYTELLQLNNNNKKDQSDKKKIGRLYLSRNFSKKHIQMVNRYMKRCSTSLIMRAMQIKITMRYYLIPSRMIIKKTQNKTRNNKCWRECGEKGTLVHYWWECKLVQPLQIIVCGCSKC